MHSVLKLTLVGYELLDHNWLNDPLTGCLMPVCSHILWE